MPLLAAVAVALSVAMVLISWSVMGGFLQTLLASGRGVIGDVKIHWPIRGFAHYEELVDRLESEETIAAATPRIESYGMVGLVDRPEPGLIVGIEPESFTRVTGYESWLHWKPLDEPVAADEREEDRRLEPLRDLVALLDWPGRLTPEMVDRITSLRWADLYRHGVELREPDLETGRPRPAAVLGIELSQYNQREQGWYRIGLPMRSSPTGKAEAVRTFLPVNGSITINGIVFDRAGNAADQVSRSFPVANEFKTGIYEIDRQTVFLPLGALQEMLNMDRAERLVEPEDPYRVEVDPETGEERFPEPETVVDPARVTTVLVKGVEGTDARALAARCREIFTAFARDHPGDVPPAESVQIQTWEDLNAQFIAAVKKETALVLFIFSFISLTAVFLVWAIFWSMVSEKTKDIGILRALGASRRGVAWLWLRYGLALGVVGAAAGGALAWGVVHYINEIHDWLGARFGLTIWDPSVYYFSRIPNDVDPAHAAMVLGGGVAAAVAGALTPALRAARMDPVRALRFE